MLVMGCRGYRAESIRGEGVRRGVGGGWPLLRGLAGETDRRWKSDQLREEPAAAPGGHWVLSLPRSCSVASGLAAGGGDVYTSSEPINTVPQPVSQNSSTAFAAMLAPLGSMLIELTHPCSFK